MVKRAKPKRWNRTRETHDPLTSLPLALHDELSIQHGARSTSLPTKLSRKEERKRRRKEKRQAGQEATSQWRARRRERLLGPKDVPNDGTKEEAKSIEKSPPDQKVETEKSRKVKKRKRSRSQDENEQFVDTERKITDENANRANNDDPDLREARRLEKLLGIDRRKKRKEAKGGTFSYADIFEEEEDDMVDLLRFCDKATRASVIEKEITVSDSDLEQEISRTETAPKAEEPENLDGNVSEDNDHVDSDEDEIESEEKQSGSEDGADSVAETVEDREASQLDSPNPHVGEESYPENGNDRVQPSAEKLAEELKPLRKPGKYVPPGARGESNAKTRVARRIRGLLNRVADANASGIAGSIIQLFEAEDTSLQLEEIASVYAACALDSIRDGSGVGYINPYVHSHAAIASHLAFRVDEAVLAWLLVPLARRITMELEILQVQEATDIAAHRQSDAFGYVAMLCLLYERKAVACSMVYDLIRIIADPLTNSRLELLLAVLRQVGAQLRLDDPSSLKDIIEFIHERAGKLAERLKGTDEEETSGVKVQVMLDLINDIKNNKLKRSMIKEARARFEWTGSPQRPLEAPLEKLLDDDYASGRWWDDVSDAKHENSQQRQKEQQQKLASSVALKKRGEDPDLALLASSLRLNTEYRKALFKAIMSSTNVSDAFERLERMSGFDAKKSHDRDAALVILHCCGAEKSFNPFYAFLAERMCKRSRHLRFTFEFALWDIFKTIPGTTKTGPMSKRKARNFGQLLAHLWNSEALSLSVLRCINDLEHGGEHERSFCVEAMRLFFAKQMESTDRDFTAPFRKLLTETWNGVDSFRISLALFLRRQVRPTLMKPQKALLSKAAQMLEDCDQSSQPS